MLHLRHVLLLRGGAGAIAAPLPLGAVALPSGGRVPAAAAAAATAAAPAVAHAAHAAAGAVGALGHRLLLWRRGTLLGLLGLGLRQPGQGSLHTSLALPRTSQDSEQPDSARLYELATGAHFSDVQLHDPQGMCFASVAVACLMLDRRQAANVTSR